MFFFILTETFHDKFVWLHSPVHPLFTWIAMCIGRWHRGWLGASVRCHGDEGCIAPAVTAQRPRWVNTDSVESAPIRNDTAEEKHAESNIKHTNTHRRHTRDGRFLVLNNFNVSIPPPSGCPSDPSIFNPISVQYSPNLGHRSWPPSQLCVHSCTCAHRHTHIDTHTHAQY